MNKAVRCKFCNEWIVWKNSKGRRVPCDITYDSYGNPIPIDNHDCRPTDYDPQYVYPTDWTKVLVRDGDNGKWQYLGTVVKNMSRRRKDKSMMSANNFKKHWGHK